MKKNDAQIHIDELPIICAVPGLIRQLFYNLINNAIKFRKKDTVPVINISSEKIKNTRNNNYYYRISVSDNGIGFDSTYSDEIFMLFKRLHSYHEFQGSGVGLSICKKIIEKHNGFIKAKSLINGGSTFIIELPEQQSASLETILNNDIVENK